MSDSLYFNLLFHKLSDSFGNINTDTLQSLSSVLSGFDLEKITDLYNNWRRNPQIWCFKPSQILDKPLEVSSLCDTDNKKVSSPKTEYNNSHMDESSLDPLMVIHVCDEPKNLRRDFYCSRKLLVSEMKYFSNYLNGEKHNAEDVDISVHCDVNIFEWLIKYVKRDQLCEEDRVCVSALKPNNVISILISSEFLKMDSLVEECISYFHDNINNLLTSTNIGSLSSNLVLRIVDRFSDLELENVIDKKDKIKSTLYKNKIECLYDSSLCQKLFTLAPATHLFKCKFCDKILIRNHDQYIKCIDSRIYVDGSGFIIYYHEINESWSLDDQLFDWVHDFRISSNTINNSAAPAAAMVYWRLWVCLNVVQCEICNEVFPLNEIGHCRYHSDVPRYGKDDGRSVIPITEGMYLCCGVKTLRFDPFQLNKGCKYKDHVVKLFTRNIKYSDEVAHLDKIINVLVTVRNLFEIPFVREHCSSDFITNVIGRNRLMVRSKFSDSIMKVSEDTNDLEVTSETHSSRPKLQPLMMIKTTSAPKSAKKQMKNNSSSPPLLPPPSSTHINSNNDFDEDLGESDEADRDDINFSGLDTRESSMSTKAGTTILIDTPQFPVFKNKKWDSNKTMRYNQDSQRQEDLRRIRQITHYLTGLRADLDKNVKHKGKEFSGGLYCKLEHQWRNEINDKLPTSTVITQRAISGLKVKQKSFIAAQPFK